MQFIKIIRVLVILFILLFSQPRIVFAQLSINKFYSLGSPDWIEIKNDSESDIDLNGYKIRDTATKDVYIWEYKTILNANSSCILDVGNRLNKAPNGDIIYILNNNNEQIFCLFYGNGNNKNDCDNKTEDLGENQDKPVADCVSETPIPIATSIPTATSTATPAPTVILTSKPISKATVVLTQKPKPKILAATDAPVGAIHESREDLSAETLVPVEVNSNNILNKLLITLGIIFIIISIAWVGFSIYNDRHALKNKIS